MLQVLQLLPWRAVVAAAAAARQGPLVVAAAAPAAEAALPAVAGAAAQGAAQGARVSGLGRKRVAGRGEGAVWVVAVVGKHRAVVWG